jgi:hypothetical protein
MDKGNKKPVIHYESDMPLRGKIENLHDKYKFKNKNDSTVTVKGWASGTEPNHPIPVQMMNLFDFTHSIFGPPDLPIPAGIAGVPKTVEVQRNTVKLKRDYNYQEYDLMANRDRSFFRGEQPMKEHFVTMPFVMNTDLPCSVLGFKF